MEKGLLRSLTVKGAIVMALAWLAGHFGSSLAEADILKAVEVLGELAGLVMVIVGRWRAGGLKGLWTSPKEK
jgi:uncharacterized membrane protein